MEVIGWLHAPATLLLRKSCWVPIEYEVRTTTTAAAMVWSPHKISDADLHSHKYPTAEKQICVVALCRWTQGRNFEQTISRAIRNQQIWVLYK